MTFSTDCGATTLWCSVVVCCWSSCNGWNGTFFRTRFASFHTHAFLLAVFVCFFILFHSFSSQARVFGKTLAHEFPISYSHTKWYLLFLRNNGRRVVGQKLTIIRIKMYFFNIHKDSIRPAALKARAIM